MAEDVANNQGNRNGGSRWSRNQGIHEGSASEEDVDHANGESNQQSQSASDSDVAGSNRHHFEDWAKQEVASSKEQALSSQFLVVLFKCLIGLSAGILFGFLMEKSRAYEPINIRGIMISKKLPFGKVLAASVSSGMLGLSIMAMVPTTYKSFQLVCIQFYGSLSTRGILACTVGGALLGTGMTISGSTPVLVFVQIGSYVSNAEYIMCGVLGGTLLFVLVRPLMEDNIRSNFKSSSNPWVQSSYFITALPLVAMFAMLVFAFELLVPWYTEVKLKKNTDELGYLEHKAWPPFWCGIAIGLLQVPLVLGAGTLLGGSTIYPTIISLPFMGSLQRKAKYLTQFKNSVHYWVQLVFIIGVVAGAHASATNSASLGRNRSVTLNEAIIGGVLMGFGSMMAGGSTNWHGSSGLGLLSILSFITMAMVFTSGIITAIIFKQYGSLTPSS